MKKGKYPKVKSINDVPADGKLRLRVVNDHYFPDGIDVISGQMKLVKREPIEGTNLISVDYEMEFDPATYALLEIYQHKFVVKNCLRAFENVETDGIENPVVAELIESTKHHINAWIEVFNFLDKHFEDETYKNRDQPE